ncbi:hypothetical protein [Thalassotalea sp. Y01]|uniref:hypothetical protein n=1 Tax=Thalassotalea sp. Y01 TaxID=2729613 RepID=UPI00145F35B9|nr:hypothetical protein [Thalassotalea sp. Y01]NMP16927.1 hypothetical protein [Thalassotalea sp. Y01]
MLSSSSKNSEQSIIKRGIFHTLIQVIVVFIVAMIIRVDIMLLSSNINEDSLTEITQQTLLLLVVCCFLSICLFTQQHRHFHVLLAGFFACMLIRELDAYFDQLIRHGFWVYIVLFVALGSITYAWQEKRDNITALTNLINHNCFYSFCTALVIILVFSRLFGMGDLWQELMGDNYVRQVKNSFEEGIELLGYSLLFYNTVVYTTDIHNHQRQVAISHK